MKKHGWPEALHDYIDASMSRQFSYGAFDCALFCADWVRIATGVDHAAQLRGYYGSMLEAYKIVGEFGSMEKMVTTLLGRDPIHAAFAQRGDVVLMQERGELGGAVDMGGPTEGLGICLGLHSAFARRTGLLMIPTLEAFAAWRVD